jgi:hypothetical protein
MIEQLRSVLRQRSGSRPQLIKICHHIEKPPHRVRPEVAAPKDGDDHELKSNTFTDLLGSFNEPK